MNHLTISDKVERDGATLVSVNNKSVIFICKCGIQHEKTKSSVLRNGGAFCKGCTNKNTSIKKIRSKIALMNSMLNLSS
jgi:hypothetical protein